MKGKFMALDNKKKLIVLAAIAICVMLCVGGVFKILGLPDFVIDENIENNLELSDNSIYFINTLLLWGNFGFILFYSTKEYSLKMISSWIFSFPVLLFCNNFANAKGFMISILLPIFMIFMIKFDWKTIKRVFLILGICTIYQLISMFVKTNIFSIIPTTNNSNVLYTAIYSIDYYIFLLVFLLYDKEVTK